MGPVCLQNARTRFKPVTSRMEDKCSTSQPLTQINQGLGYRHMQIRLHAATAKRFYKTTLAFSVKQQTRRT